MTSNEILKADMLDILFDNRNKQYGAYALRKNYNSRLGMALGISLSIAALLFFLLPKTNSSGNRLIEEPVIVVKTVEFPPEAKKIIPPPVKKIQEQIFRQKQFTKMVIVNKQTSDPPPDIRELETNIISTKTVDGPIFNGRVPIINESVTKTEQGKPEPVAKEAPVQREPEFPGGQEAWLNFLRKNLIAPTELEPGEKKTVLIRFFVSTDGTVNNFEVLQSAGKVFDSEVIRVLKKMPKWKPAIQNGQSVARAFTQPVTFVGVEE